MFSAAACFVIGSSCARSIILNRPALLTARPNQRSDVRVHRLQVDGGSTSLPWPSARPRLIPTRPKPKIGPNCVDGVSTTSRFAPLFEGLKDLANDDRIS
jgi:hypothetical protein